jgi:glycosyltransferase involved in cell wall biosynthesis
MLESGDQQIIQVRDFSITIVTCSRNRAGLLQAKVIPSLLNQTDRDFEWVVVNDGADPQTRRVAIGLQVDFSIAYREIEHAKNGFGLAHGRNIGLEAATGNIMALLVWI